MENRKILVVDDESDVLGFLKLLLEPPIHIATLSYPLLLTSLAQYFNGGVITLRAILQKSRLQ